MQAHVLSIDPRPGADAGLRAYLCRASEGPIDFTVECVGTLKAALERLCDSTMPQVLLLDLAVDSVLEHGALARLATSNHAVPIVVVGDGDGEDARLPVLAAGAFEYLARGTVTPVLLVHTLRSALLSAQTNSSASEYQTRYELLVAGAHDGVWDWVVGEDRVFMSPPMKHVLGLDDEPSSQVPLNMWTAHVDSRDRPGLKAALAAHRNATSSLLEHEHRIIGGPHSGARVLLRGAIARGANGQATRIAGTLTNLSALKAGSALATNGVLYDQLTQLPNRALLLDRIGQLLKRLERRPEHLFAVLCIDINRFKVVNDLMGQGVGDALLTGLARRLEAIVQPEDTLARLGSDEFAVVLASPTGLNDALELAAHISRLLHEPFYIGDHKLDIRVSIGICDSSAGYTQPQDLLRDANIALRNPHAGSGPAANVRVFSKAMRSSILARHQLETDLSRAVTAGQLQAHYQPIIALDTGTVVGFEALIRWQHPQRGILPPDAFLGIAEECGAILPMSWWMLEEATRQLVQWQADFPQARKLGMSINVSGKLFEDPDVLARMQDLVCRLAPAPQSLHLEITESIALDHGTEVLALLDGVRALGVQLDIDDFGTGYASLSYLQRFCYDVLKIDRSFVAQIARRNDSNAIVRALVALARSLGMTVVAEGVESHEQLEALKLLNCQQAQGFLFSKPMASGDVQDRLRNAGSAGLNYADVLG